MNIISYLREFRVMDYAVFDFVVSIIGIYLLSPVLTKLFRKVGIDIPVLNWLFLTIPIGILFHVIFGSITPMTRDFLDPSGHYVLKIIIISLLIFGFRGIKVVKLK